MSYQADSFVADEQPTTAKWNKLWSNDAAFNDGSGFATGVLQRNPYSFSAYLSADQSGVADANYETVECDTEFVDNNDDYDSATNYRHDVPIDGLYAYMGFVQTPEATSDTSGRFLVDGSDDYNVARVSSPSGTRTFRQAWGFIMLELNAAQYVNWQGYGNVASGNVTFNGVAGGQQSAGRFSGFLVHPT